MIIIITRLLNILNIKNLTPHNKVLCSKVIVVYQYPSFNLPFFLRNTPCQTLYLEGSPLEFLILMALA